VAVLVLGITIACGTAPALFITRGDLGGFLKSGAAGIKTYGSNRRSFSPREWLAALQVVLALVLLVGTALLVRSLTSTLAMPLGLEMKRVAVIVAELPPLPGLEAARLRFFQQHNLNPFASYGPRDRTVLEDLSRTLEPDLQAQRTRNLLFFLEATQRLQSLPKVASVGLLLPAPFTSDVSQGILMGRSVYKFKPRSGGELPPHVSSVVGFASPEAFPTLGIRVVAGRGFNRSDVADALASQGGTCTECSLSAGNGRERDHLLPAMVNESLARQFWPHGEAVGERLYTAGQLRVVVGVVSDFLQGGAKGSVIPAVYSPFTGTTGKGTFVVKLRDDVPLHQFAQSVNTVLGDLSLDLPPLEIQSMQDLTTRPLRGLRLTLTLLACFSVLGTVVASLGVYAAATLLAAEQKREMGIRLALGADARQVQWLALWRSTRLAVVSLPLGLFVSWVFARQASHLLLHVSQVDPVAYVSSTVLVLLVVLTAGFLPALRAARTDPAAALRQE
jgi:hypothetical protein